MDREQSRGEPRRPLVLAIEHLLGESQHENRRQHIKRNVRRVKRYGAAGAERVLELEREDRERTIAVPAGLGRPIRLLENAPPVGDTMDERVPLDDESIVVRELVDDAD